MRADRENAIVAKEHVLGPAQPDPLGAEAARGPGLGRGLRIGAYVQAAHRVGPAHHAVEIGAGVRSDHRRRAKHHLPGAAVDGHDIAHCQRHAVDLDDAGGEIELQIARSRHARAAHAPRHHRRMAGHAAAAGENSARRVHAVNVFGAGLGARKDDVLARPGAHLRFGGVEHKAAAGRPRRRGETARQNPAFGRRVEHRMQQLFEAQRVDTAQRLGAIDQPFVDHIDGDLERRDCRPLAGPRLQDIQAALLDGKFHVLHIAIMRLETLQDSGLNCAWTSGMACSSDGASSSPSVPPVSGSGVRSPATTSSPCAFTRNSRISGALRSTGCA